MAIFEIPLKVGAQEFITPLDGTSYHFRLLWRDPVGWFLDISTSDLVPLVLGISLVTGVNLIQQYQHKIKGELWILTDNLDNPDYQSVGNALKLYWINP